MIPNPHCLPSKKSCYGMGFIVDTFQIFLKLNGGYKVINFRITGIEAIVQNQ